eukprot:5179591-Pyramimonas_sp.AAC.1
MFPWVGLARRTRTCELRSCGKVARIMRARMGRAVIGDRAWENIGFCASLKCRPRRALEVQAGPAAI